MLPGNRASGSEASRLARPLLLAPAGAFTEKTFRFVADCVRYARERFPEVEFGMHRCSVVDFFEKNRFIPHPTFSPCTEHLKIDPMEVWDQARGVTIDLIGFVRHEMSRRGEKFLGSEADVVRFPIAHLTDDQCFEIVDREIGWHPPIYDIRDKAGKRVFTHNNCLPCKNMTRKQLASVATHFPAYAARPRRWPTGSAITGAARLSTATHAGLYTFH